MVNHSKKSVLILVDGMPAGGTERQIVELLKGFQNNKKIRILIGVLEKGGERETEAYKYASEVVPIKRFFKYDFSFVIPLLKIVKKYQIDLIHTFGCSSDFGGVIASKIHKIPIINGSIRNARSRLNRRDLFSKYCMYFSTWIVANSHAGLKAYGMDKMKNTCVIHNGIDMKRFVAIESKSLTSPTLCMVGNFTQKKDQKKLIDTIPLLIEHYPHLKLILVGRGKKLIELETQVQTLKINNHVSFVTDCNHPESIIGKCDIGLLLSPEGEGLSNVIMEYMAMAKPVIASAKGGNAELVKHGKTGFLINDQTSDEICKYVKYLIDSPDIANQMGMEGKRVLMSKFSLSNMIENYEKLYCSLIEN